MVDPTVYDPEELAVLASALARPATMTLEDIIAERPDVHGATLRASRRWWARWADAIRDEDAATAREGVPLIGVDDRWRQPRVRMDDDTRLEECDWRARRDSHCHCFRCFGQEIEVLMARSILSPCGDVANCYWCRSAGVDECSAEGIAAGARRLAAQARGEVQPTARRRRAKAAGPRKERA